MLEIRHVSIKKKSGTPMEFHTHSPFLSKLLKRKYPNPKARIEAKAQSMGSRSGPGLTDNHGMSEQSNISII
jgi:hypothetical protein